MTIFYVVARRVFLNIYGVINIQYHRFFLVLDLRRCQGSNPHLYDNLRFHLFQKLYFRIFSIMYDIMYQNYLEIIEYPTPNISFTTKFLIFTRLFSCCLDITDSESASVESQLGIVMKIQCPKVNTYLIIHTLSAYVY